MTSLPAHPSEKKLGLVIDLDICVGCHACAVNCKEWNTGGHMAPLTNREPYGADPLGVWFNRVHTYEAGDGADGRTVHFPRSCLHCEQPACVEVCPTGASYKRAEDGIVLVNESLCIGCKLCSWACPYGAREYDYDSGTMKKCTLCIDRIYNENLEEIDRVPACVATCPAHARHFGDLGDPDSGVSKLVAERGGYDLMPEMGYAPVNKYLPPRPRQTTAGCTGAPAVLQPADDSSAGNAVLRWIDRLLSRQSILYASGIVRHLLHRGVGRGLWPAAAAGRRRRARLAAAGSLVRRRRARPVAGGHHGRPPVLHVSPRPSRAGLAGCFAVALLLAVARGAGQPDHLCSGPRLRARLGAARPQQRRLGAVRADCRRLGRHHRLLHRHDLCVAEADPALAQWLCRALLSAARRDDGRALAQCPRPSLRPVVGRPDAVRDRRARHRLAGEAGLLAVHRWVAQREHSGNGDRPRPSRKGPFVRGAAHRGKLPDARDGLPHRAQACLS